MERIKDDQLIRFDWAVRLLRHKADHTILNGFLSSLLDQPIRITRLLESEGNQEYADDKLNRVDILAENEYGEKILIEVQNDSEDSYFHRMAYGTSKLITEYLKLGQRYDKISKVYSVNIVYFNLGMGSDYVYTGQTVFKGMHTGEILQLPERLKRKYEISHVSDIFPEYFILNVTDFNKWSQDDLDQWMYFLSTNEIPADATAPGLSEAREELRVASLSPEDRIEYYTHMNNMVTARSMIETAHDTGEYEGWQKGRAEGLSEGREEGRAEGREEGKLEERIDIVKTMLAEGMDLELISRLSKMPIEEIQRIAGRDR